SPSEDSIRRVRSAIPLSPDRTGSARRADRCLASRYLTCLACLSLLPSPAGHRGGFVFLHRHQALDVMPVERGCPGLSNIRGGIPPGHWTAVEAVTAMTRSTCRRTPPSLAAWTLERELAETT